MEQLAIIYQRPITHPSRTLSRQSDLHLEREPLPDLFSESTDVCYLCLKEAY